MAEEKRGKPRLKDFPAGYWIVIMFEFFERGSYYGVMSILSVYMTEILGFSKGGVGVIKSTIQPLLYFLPILTGAIADRMGYRKMLMVAFTLLGLGYALTSQMTEYTAVFISRVVMGFGAGAFKPVISGTIAKLTDERTSTLGFGIFYWSINLGAFLFPLVLVPMLKAISWHYVLIAAAIGTGSMLIPTMFFFKEPPRTGDDQKAPLGQMLKDVLRKLLMVVRDWRFILFIAIYSMFWFLYFQMFDTVLWYVQDFVDASPLNTFISGVIGFDWKFDVEHVTVINALTIVLLQLFVSRIVSKTKALPTMITGIAIGTIGMAILSLSSGIWVFMLGIFMFSIGEMTAHPKYISYLGTIAPADKKATYMGFGFLYGAIGSFFGPYIGATLYVKLIDNPMIAYIKLKLTEIGAPHPSNAPIGELLTVAEKAGIPKQDILMQAHPSELWLIFSGIGILSIVCLLLYQKFIVPKPTT